jgi:L-threonylcarbamoyladenylate synthase
LESTVLQVTPEGPLLLRPGGTTLEDIEALIGPVQIAATPASDRPATGLVSPGALPSHYAPRTPLRLLTASASVTEAFVPARTGLLTFQPADGAHSYACVEVLSTTGDLREAAASFFAALRRLDACGLDLIVAGLFPDVGLGRALNDRLRRAAHA